MYFAGYILSSQWTSGWASQVVGALKSALNCKPGVLFAHLATGMTRKKFTYLLGSFLPYQIGVMVVPL